MGSYAIDECFFMSLRHGHEPGQSRIEGGYRLAPESVALVRTTPPEPARRTERRNLDSRRRLLRRIRVEYAEMPGLRLTATQAARLFALRIDVCVRVLGQLVEVQELRRDDAGAYVRNGTLP
jgi:hypothetical protein